MSEVLKYKAIGGMAQRSRIGGADYVRLSDYDELQQRLTLSEQRESDLKKLICAVINEAPTGFSALKVDLAHRVNSALNQDESIEALGTRPAGCCCPPKDHTGIWAAAMCPVHFGLRRNLGVK